MRIAIAGGNGYIGRRLTRVLRESGHVVVWFSHTPGRARDAGAFAPDYEMVFEPHEPNGTWADELAEVDAVVNLSGHPISSRWNQRVKHLIRDSRVETGRALVNRLDELNTTDRPAVYVSASGIGYYGDRGADELSEREPAGEDWLSSLAEDWEAEALKAADLGMRVVVLRTGVVLGDAGIVPRMALPFRLFLGGPVGDGKRYVSWIHIEDLVALYAFAIESERLSGPVNAAAEAVPMSEFARELGRVLHRPSWFPVPGLVLRLVLGEIGPYTLMSQRADTRKLAESSFELRFPDTRTALADALRGHVPSDDE